MKSIFKLFLAVAVLAFSAVACGTLENNAEPEVLKDGKHISKMVFRGSVAGYEGATVRDDSTKSESSWTDGDVVYIAFYNGTDIVPGTAVYSESDGWSVSYDGDLAEGSSQTCEVRFFVNTTFSNEVLVTLNPHTEIYEDSAGVFDFNGNTISVTASLTPKTGRIRFTGNAADVIYVTGITTYTTFSPAGNQFSTTNAALSLIVDELGSTPYVYGYFTYNDRKLGIVGSDFAYTRTCNESVFQAGDSGYMKIPSTSSHNNWKTGLLLTVNGVDFKMLSLVGYSTGYSLLAETETTTALYNAVIGTSSSGDYRPRSDNYPQWQTFITSLNNTTGLSFFIPSKDLWQFAATGGLSSQGYMYSGSNTPGDVAWYSGNSGSSTHLVKQLAPNELGFYDMSGNEAEWTSSTPTTNSGDRYYSGTSSSTYLNRHYVMGGKYNDNEDYLRPSNTTVSEYYSHTSIDHKYGLRLALRFD